MNKEYAVEVAKEQFSKIEKYASDNYMHSYSLYSKPGEQYGKKEDFIKYIHYDVCTALEFICHENDLSENEFSIMSASEKFGDAYLPSLLETWVSEYEKSNKQEFPLVGSISLMLVIDDKFGLTGNISRGFLHALLVLFQLIVDSDEDETRRNSKMRIAQGMITSILSTAEARKLDLGLQRSVVETRKQILDNIAKLDDYLSDMEYFLNRQFALDRIKLGTCFIAIKGEDGYRFYPSRFVGYVDNSRVEHEYDYLKDGMETNKAIETVLRKKPVYKQELEDEYYKYCSWLGIKAGNNGAWGVQRKYWTL